MKAALTQWCNLTKESAIKALEKFAKSLESHQTGILNYCLYPINTAKLEAINNKIGLVRRRAYGFHDQHYFILKIFQASGF
jgi:transposase